MLIFDSKRRCEALLVCNSNEIDAFHDFIFIIVNY